MSSPCPVSCPPNQPPPPLRPQASPNAASAGADDLMSFRDAWTNIIYPKIWEEYEDLLGRIPFRIEAKEDIKVAKEVAKKEKKDEEKKEKKNKKDPAVPDQHVVNKLKSILAEVKKHGERRNAFLNLAWTGPVDNTSLQSDISYEKVANMALDLFVDTSSAASADVAPLDGDEEEKVGEAQKSVQAVMLSKGALPWNIPPTVEKGFEIPIMVCDTDVLPETGKFIRMGMDVVVNAVWLALYWAVLEQNDAAVSAIKHLILDWPMDFVLIKGSTPEEIEENRFKWAVNYSAKVERLRGFVGLENNNMMRIVAKVALIVKLKLVSQKKANAETVHKWLVDNVKWGVCNCPDVLTVTRLMTNWAAIAMHPRAVNLIDASTNRWGRGNCLDFPTKLAIIVQKTDKSSIGYVIEALYCHMWRKGVPDPYGAKELQRVIPDILWVRSYTKSLLKQYPEVFKVPTEVADPLAQQTIALAKNFLDSPLAFFMRTESPDRDPTWVQSLPTEALRCLMKHALEMNQGFYHSELRGALSNIGSADKYSLEKFHQSGRVAQRFVKGFAIAYDSLVGPGAASAGAGEGTPDGQAGEGTQEGKAPAEQDVIPQKKADAPDELNTFRAQCEQFCRKELEARLVSLAAENGTHSEIQVSVTNTRMYINLTASVSCMAFYDVKNAKLCNIFEGEGYSPPCFAFHSVPHQSFPEVDMFPIFYDFSAIFRFWAVFDFSFFIRDFV